MSNERRLSSLSQLANVKTNEQQETDKVEVTVNNNDDVDTNENQDVTTHEDDNVGNNENSEVTTNDDYEPTLLKKIASKKQVKFDKTQVSVYLDDDVHKKYVKFGKKYGRGARSELINELLRRELKDY